MIKKKKLRFIIANVLIITVILLSNFVFHAEDLQTFTAFISLIPIFAIFKFDGRIPVAYAILMLVFAAVVLGVYNDETLANVFAIYAYWLLVVGVVCLFIEYVREERKIRRRA